MRNILNEFAHLSIWTKPLIIIRKIFVPGTNNIVNSAGGDHMAWMSRVESAAANTLKINDYKEMKLPNTFNIHFVLISR
jgi:hypothetical protein